MNNDWRSIVERVMIDEGGAWADAVEAVKDYFPDLTSEQIRRRCRTAISGSKRAKDWQYSKCTTKEEKPVEAHQKPEKPKKVEVVENLVPVEHDAEWRGNRIITFGLMGDTQICSKYTQLTYLHKFYDVCVERGIKTIYHTGDIDEGERMRAGHAYECYKHGADEHVNEIACVYPRREGVTTYFITGNHDASMIKHCGFDIGNAIAARRSDMIYLGRDSANIHLTPNCTLRLRHPWNGTSYSLSYKTQKMVDGMRTANKPDILAIGHYHKAEYLFYGDVHCFQTGCFQGDTPFTEGNGIAVHMGGWIVTVEVDKSGRIQRIVPEYIPFYEGIKDDYKNFEHLRG